ncbi:hypothetical protein FPOA_09199 [Fusarium poae]|uniref:Uncharacterized protein n=1 Tax=Fusarium poae TaxID=36050 RepID=A0A1B8AR70_FUSPO|nr:hypothetical protein FPOA_09199 [Fusarium poae]
MPIKTHITADQRVKLIARQIQRFNAQNQQRSDPWPTSNHLTDEDIALAQTLDTEPHILKLDGEQTFPSRWVDKPTSLATTLRHWRQTMGPTNEDRKIDKDDKDIVVNMDTESDSHCRSDFGQGELDGNHSKPRFRFRLPLRIIPSEQIVQRHKATSCDFDGKADHNQTIDKTHDEKPKNNVQLDRLHQSNNGLEEEVHDDKSEYKKVMNQLCKLSLDYNHLRHELAQEKREKVELRDQLETLQHQIDELQKENNNLRGDTAAQKQNLAFAGSEKDDKSKKGMEEDLPQDILERLRRDLRAKRREKQERRR